MDPIYPAITIPHIQNPSRLYAFPLLGFVIKWIILIPVWIWLFIISLAAVILVIINSFVVLFTGKYWAPAYQVILGLLRLSARVSFFWYGLTDKYPGFSLNNSGDVVLDMPIPQSPNRLFALPFLGSLARFILLIPYYIYTTIITYGSYIGVFVSFIPVLFMKRYPKSTYELAYDGVRLNSSTSVYIFGLSDKYPSFHISMNHKAIKIILIFLGALLFLLNIINSTNNSNSNSNSGKTPVTQRPTPNNF